MSHNLKKRLIFTFVVLAGWIRQRMMRSDVAYKLLFIESLTGFRTMMGKWKAWYCLEKARRECPAYGRFLGAHPGEVRLVGWTPDFSAIVETDKPSYVKPFTMAERCHGGVIPTRGAVIDTSSGSTGKPTAWVRGKDEREAGARVMQIALRQLIPNKQILFLNAFALGPWATGMCVSHAVSEECLLVSVGPDVDKIIDVMNDFGHDKFMYVIAGYPPFLKMLVDSKAVDWKRFDTIAFYGGEGMSEAMRDYLLGAFKAVYGDYGASDLEINIGAENDFTVGLRRLMAKHEGLRHKLNSRIATLAGLERLSDALPHIFQYNQLDYVVETNARRAHCDALPGQQCGAQNSLQHPRQRLRAALPRTFGHPQGRRPERHRPARGDRRAAPDVPLRALGSGCVVLWLQDSSGRHREDFLRDERHGFDLQ